MFEDIDKYCERISPALWSEPLNIVSNFAFLIAGFILVRLYQSRLNDQKRKDWDIQGLIVLLFIIGIGSSLWHIYAKNWSLYTDVIPILLFINIGMISCLYRVVGCSFSLTAGMFLFYQLFNYSLQSIFEKDFLNGSIFYLPTWLLLIGISVVLKRRNNEYSQQFIGIFFVFTLALLFRTIDLGICSVVPTGTHFIWHILSAYMMYLLVRILILNNIRFQAG